MISLSSLRPAWAAFAFCVCSASSLLAEDRWPKLTPAEFSQAPALIDPEAGAEIMVAETSIDESSPTDARWNYFIRVRIVDDRGVTRFSKIELPYDNDTSLSSIEAHTYKPDGTVLTLDRKDIFDRDVVKTRSSRRSIKSFAPPGLEAGVILEYRYVEMRDRKTFFWPLRFQRDLPARLVRFRLLPFPLPGSAVNSLSFNLPQFALKRDFQGYFTFEATNLKGWKDEPFQVPPLQQQPSALVYFSRDNGKETPAHFWAESSRQLYERMERVAKPSKAVRAALATMISLDDAPEVKLQKIHDAVRTRIVNSDRDTSGYTREQRQKLPKNDNAEETLERGHGTSDDIVIAFTALARAAGFDARLAMANDRTVLLYSDTLFGPFVFPKLVATVRMGEAWTFSDPGATYFPLGALEWKYTGTTALVADREHALLPKVPLLPSAKSARSRHATFTLDEQGTLEGLVTVTHTGYFDAAAKHQYDALSKEEREKRLKEDVQKQFPLAELSEITFEHAADPLQPLTLSYHLRVPDFAERTGSRLFVQAAALHKGVPPLFEATTRRSPVVFHHLYREEDAIEIVVPEGFALEAGNAPPALDLGNFGKYATSVGYSQKSRKIAYKREFELRSASASVKYYPALKGIFEEIQMRDNHVLTFRAAAENTASVVAPEAVSSAGGNEK